MTGLLRSVWRGLTHLLVDRIDAYVTPSADARAREMGLTVERIPGTRIHVYSRGGRGYGPTRALSAGTPTEDGEQR